MPQGLPFQLHHYLELVDSTGRVVREDKRDHLSLEASPIMQRLGIAAEQWLSLSCEFEQHFSGAVGKERLLLNYHQGLGHKRTTGLARCRSLLNSA